MRIAMFGIYPGGRKNLVDSSVGILSQTGHRVKVMSPFDMAGEMLSDDLHDHQPVSRILDDVSLEIDLKSLASDSVVEMPYSFPWIFKRDAVQSRLTVSVEDKAIGKEFGVFFQEEKIKKYDAVLYIDLDSEGLVGCDETFGLSKKDIDDWKMFEKYRLRALCRRSNVLYSAFTAKETLVSDIAKRIEIILGSK